MGDIGSMEEQIPDFPFRWTGHIYSVSELTSAIKEIIETEFPLLCVRGQVSNISRPLSGHIYFSLKDETAVLSVVWFRSNHHISPGNIARRLSPGTEVLCVGRMSVYPPGGTYQLIAEYVVDIGLGTYYLQLEALKKKLASQGFFSPERKRKIKKNPFRVAVITSPAGAAIRDFLKIVREKSIPCEVRIYPCSVQGEVAEQEIVSMIERANRDGWAEVLVLIRGGGSPEDLMVFNSERVAQAIFRSHLPVITGIGHEIDHSIADMTADYRCATPTHVANFLWEDRDYYLQELDEMYSRMLSCMERILSSHEREVRRMASYLRLTSPVRKMDDVCARCREMRLRLVNAIHKHFDVCRKEILTVTKELVGFSRHPIFQEHSHLLRDLFSRLSMAMERRVQSLEREMDSVGAHLSSLDPYLPLRRGYSILMHRGRVIASVNDVDRGDKLYAQLVDGRIFCEVKAIEEDADGGK